MSSSRRQIRLAAVLCVTLSIAASAQPTAACPFCQAIKPSFAQQREVAGAVVLAELVERQGERYLVRIQQSWKGSDRFHAGDKVAIQVDGGQPTAGLLVLIAPPAERPVEEWVWSYFPVNETTAAYFARAPDLRKPNAERLQYFARYLEHDDPLVAEDAFLEFGHAPWDEVAQVADRLPMSKLRDWVVDPTVPDARKGFYGLALGLAKTETDRAESVRVLHKLIGEKHDDFRAGFDGMCAGLLLAEGEPGLALLRQRYLDDPKSAVGDVRHAHSAVRFYYEFGRDIPHDKVAAAIRPLVDRVETSAAAITDLARWKDWTALETIAALPARRDFTAPDIFRAVVGYLHACPLPAAAEYLDRLRRLDAKGVSAAEQELSPISGN